MGIKGLSKLLQELAPSSFKEQELKSYFGRILAVDASMALYQFLIAVRQQGVNGQLTNDVGDVTSHLVGIFYRTIRMVENGLKPVFVFDGKPPDFKEMKELQKRQENREKAQQEYKDAQDLENEEKMAQMEKRLVKVNKQHVEETQRLLDCLGIPWIQASGEAEAQCAYMARKGIVYGTATEDMDALTFGTPRLIRHLTMSEARKMPILEFDLNKVLIELKVTMDQFIDICILCGCDYSASIRGIGPKKAFEYITKYGNIETLLKNLDETKYKVPDNFLFDECRKLFKNPDVNEVNEQSIKWKECNEENVLKFLVEEKGFNEERVKGGLKRLKDSKGKASQQRLDSFFQLEPPKSVSTPNSIGKKRKQMESLKKSDKKNDKNKK